MPDYRYISQAGIGVNALLQLLGKPLPTIVNTVKRLQSQTCELRLGITKSFEPELLLGLLTLHHSHQGRSFQQQHLQGKVIGGEDFRGTKLPGA